MCVAVKRHTSREKNCHTCFPITLRRVPRSLMMPLVPTAIFNVLAVPSAELGDELLFHLLARHVRGQPFAFHALDRHVLDLVSMQRP